MPHATADYSSSSNDAITSPTKLEHGISPVQTLHTRRNSSEDRIEYDVGTPVDMYGSSSSSSMHNVNTIGDGEMSPITVFTPLTLTLQEKRQMMSMAASEERVSEDPLARLGYKPLTTPTTPASPYGYGIPHIPSGVAINRRDSNADKVPFTETTGYWLALYFTFNLGLTLYNKVVLVNFPFPYVSLLLGDKVTKFSYLRCLQTLTGLHALSGCVGCYLALERGAYVSCTRCLHGDHVADLDSTSDAS
jgi:hypothetical protein